MLSRANLGKHNKILYDSDLEAFQIKLFIASYKKTNVNIKGSDKTQDATENRNVKDSIASLKTDDVLIILKNFLITVLYPLSFQMTQLFEHS